LGEEGREMIIDVKSPDGNIYAIMEYVQRLLRAAHREKEIDRVLGDMKRGGYRHLLKVAEKETFWSITFTGVDE